MAIYTTELRTICETLTGMSGGYDDVDTIIALSVPKIFDFDFPIFDENYRTELCKKILLHFYTREIGAETYGLWHLYLKRKLTEIMPYYNKLYDTTLLKFDPLSDVDVTTQHQSTANSESTETSNAVTTTGQESSTSTSSSGRDRFSDTPQGRLSDVENNLYLNEFRATDDTGSTSSNLQGLSNTQNERASGREDKSSFVDRVTGKRGGTSYPKMIQELRESFIKVDAMILNDLEPLFMGVWG